MCVSTISGPPPRAPNRPVAPRCRCRGSRGPRRGPPGDARRGPPGGRGRGQQRGEPRSPAARARGRNECTNPGATGTPDPTTIVLTEPATSNSRRSMNLRADATTDEQASNLQTTCKNCAAHAKQNQMCCCTGPNASQLNLQGMPGRRPAQPSQTARRRPPRGPAEPPPSQQRTSSDGARRLHPTVAIVERKAKSWSARHPPPAPHDCAFGEVRQGVAWATPEVRSEGHSEVRPGVGDQGSELGKRWCHPRRACAKTPVLSHRGSRPKDGATGAQHARRRWHCFSPPSGAIGGGAARSGVPSILVGRRRARARGGEGRISEDQEHCSPTVRDKEDPYTRAGAASGLGRRAEAEEAPLS